MIWQLWRNGPIVDTSKEMHRSNIGEGVHFLICSRDSAKLPGQYLLGSIPKYLFVVESASIVQTVWKKKCDQNYKQTPSAAKQYGEGKSP